MSLFGFLRFFVQISGMDLRFFCPKSKFSALNYFCCAPASLKRLCCSVVDQPSNHPQKLLEEIMVFRWAKYYWCRRASGIHARRWLRVTRWWKLLLSLSLPKPRMLHAQRTNILPKTFCQCDQRRRRRQVNQSTDWEEEIVHQLPRAKQEAENERKVNQLFRGEEKAEKEKQVFERSEELKWGNRFLFNVYTCLDSTRIIRDHKLLISGEESWTGFHEENSLTIQPPITHWRPCHVL